MEACALVHEDPGEIAASDAPIEDHIAAPIEDHIAAQSDSLHADICARHYELLTWIAAYDATAAWEDDGCRDMAMWLSGRLGIRPYTARKWVASAHAIKHLRQVSEALRTGALCLDKVVELTRFATPESEARLVTWARRVSVAAIRVEAERANGPEVEETRDTERARSLRWWWFDDNRALGLEGYFPAAQGAAIVAAIERAAKEVPDPSEESGDHDFDTPSERRDRRCDALWAMASQTISRHSHADRATVVVHAALSALGDRPPFGELAGGGVLNPETVRRLSCDARLQFVLTDATGNPLGIGRTSRNVPEWLMRQLRFRDQGCTFPGCGTRAFLNAHHIWHWHDGGPTDYYNLRLVCSWHHKLLHEFGWVIRIGHDDKVMWFRPDGSRYHPGPDPPARRGEFVAAPREFLRRR